jgi:predicted transcriptional regulator
MAIDEGHIVCLICGAAFRQLTRGHLGGHDTTPSEYRQRFGYGRDQALMGRAVQRGHAERAVERRRR